MDTITEYFSIYPKVPDNHMWALQFQMQVLIEIKVLFLEEEVPPVKQWGNFNIPAFAGSQLCVKHNDPSVGNFHYTSN